MPDYSYTFTVNSDTDVLAETACTELFRHEMRLESDASDTSLKLGLITNPIFVAVFSPEGDVGFKLDSTGTDLIKAFPFGIAMDEDGLGIDEILLTNGAGNALDIIVIAAE